jgi:uracil-DNA glycosylase
MTASKVERMAEVVEAIRDLDTSPLYAYRREKGYKPVIGEGDLDAKVMFIGEAPGAHKQRPVGPSSAVPARSWMSSWPPSV